MNLYSIQDTIGLLNGSDSVVNDDSLSFITDNLQMIFKELLYFIDDYYFIVSDFAYIKFITNSRTESGDNRDKLFV